MYKKHPSSTAALAAATILFGVHPGQAQESPLTCRKDGTSIVCNVVAAQIHIDDVILNHGNCLSLTKTMDVLEKSEQAAISSNQITSAQIAEIKKTYNGHMSVEEKASGPAKARRAQAGAG
jgi:hypothetical protein